MTSPFTNSQVPGPMAGGRTAKPPRAFQAAAPTGNIRDRTRRGVLHGLFGKLSESQRSDHNHNHDSPVTVLCPACRAEDPNPGVRHETVPPPATYSMVCVPSDTGGAQRPTRAALTASGGEVWAWFVLGHLAWMSAGQQEQARLVQQAAQRFVDLTPTQLHIRTLYRPQNARDRAHRLEARTRKHNGPLPDVPEAAGLDNGTWRKMLDTQTRRQYHPDLWEQITMLGVRVAVNVKLKTARAFLYNIDANPDLAARLDHITTAVAGAGLEGVPASPVDMDRLWQHSCGLGLPEHMTGRWWVLEEDLTSYTDEIVFGTTALADTIQVAARGQEVEEFKHVAILSMGPTEQIQVPDHDDPWMSWTRELGFPVEWSARVDLLYGRDAAGMFQKLEDEADDQEKHYLKYGDRPPIAVERAQDELRSAYDEVKSGHALQSTCAFGTWHLAVWGRDRREVLQRVAEVQRAHSPQINWRLDSGQWSAFRGFWPGEPLPRAGYRRTLTVMGLGMAMPHISPGLGDDNGIYLGYTTRGGWTPVCFDTHYATGRAGISGLYSITAVPGAGKSLLLGELAIGSARRGIRTIVLDPSGPLANLATLPELAPHTQVWDFRRAAPGTLNSWGLIPEPARRDYDTDDEWMAAVSEARYARQELARDVIPMLVNPGLLAPGLFAGEAIDAAIGLVGGDVDRNLWDIVDVLARLGDDDRYRHLREIGRRLAENLSSLADQPLAKVYFPVRGERQVVDGGLDSTKTLTIMVMSGLEAAPADGGPMTFRQRMSVPANYLATFLISRFVYDLPRTVPKSILGDELGLMSGPAKTSLFDRLARDSRKWQAFVALADQNPATVRGLSEQIRNLLGGIIVGRLQGPDAISDAAELLPGDGWEDIIPSLETGEFVYLDAKRRINTFQVDPYWYPRAFAALRTDAAKDDQGPDLWEPGALADEKIGDGR